MNLFKNDEELFENKLWLADHNFNITFRNRVKTIKCKIRPIFFTNLLCESNRAERARLVFRKERRKTGLVAMPGDPGAWELIDFFIFWKLSFKEVVTPLHICSYLLGGLVGRDWAITGFSTVFSTKGGVPTVFRSLFLLKYNGCYET